MQYGFVIDHRKCIGCHACTVACKSENLVPVGSFRTWVKYTEIGTFPSVRRHFAVLRCNHCSRAPCVTLCPVNALEKRVDGIVDLDRDVCIGCKGCIQACPYDAIYLNEDTGSAEKCHYCAHRIEQNLEPACVTVCPERAIVAGDLHDPDSEVARLAALPDAQVRRAEQRTGPNVHYVGSDPVSLRPGYAADPPTYLWSERRLPPPDWPSDHEVHPTARTVLDVSHKPYWGWKISVYLVTKGIAGGAAMLAPFAGVLGLGGAAAAYAPEIIAAVFTALTTVLLVVDLARPRKFALLLFRPNTRSWIVRGAWVLMGFSALTVTILALRWLGFDAAATALRWPNALLGALAAGYTAFLFAQCEGRDLWQSPLLLPHLLAQALLLGASVLLVTAPTLALALVATIGALLHLGFALAEAHGHHPTENGRQAASLLTRIPSWPGSHRRAFREGLELGTVAAVSSVILAALGWLSPPAGLLLAVAIACGMFLYEQAFVRAGQLPPLS
jgi:Fe-S-cluster-containing dehydrogenase component